MRGAGAGVVEGNNGCHAEFYEEKISMSKFNTTYVDTMSSSCDGDAKYNARYSLTLFRQGATSINRTAIVILKNPASTCKDHVFFSTSLKDVYDVDKTTSHIINTLFANATPYDKIITLNLFPYYDNIPVTINSVYKNLSTAPHISYQTNLTKIVSILQNNSGADVFCAWGGCSKIKTSIYHCAIRDIYAVLQKCSNSIYLYQAGTQIPVLLPRTRITIKWLKSQGYLYPPHGITW